MAKIKTKAGKGIVNMKMKGSVTIYDAKHIKADVDEAVAKGEEIILDLSKVSEIDTTGVQLLVYAKQRAENTNIKLTLKNHSQPVVEAIDLYGLAAFLGGPVLLGSEQS